MRRVKKTVPLLAQSIGICLCNTLHQEKKEKRSLYPYFWWTQWFLFLWDRLRFTHDWAASNNEFLPRFTTQCHECHFPWLTIEEKKGKENLNFHFSAFKSWIPIVWTYKLSNLHSTKCVFCQVSSSAPHASHQCHVSPKFFFLRKGLYIIQGGTHWGCHGLVYLLANHSEL